eukprot:scaffold111850_cov58-Attheya_sp.AAC.2
MDRSCGWLGRVTLHVPMCAIDASRSFGSNAGGLIAIRDLAPEYDVDLIRLFVSSTVYRIKHPECAA